MTILICMFAESIRCQKAFEARASSKIGTPEWSILIVGIRIC